MKNKIGYISLHRSLIDKGWYSQPGFVHLWIHLLLKANHESNEFWFNGQNIKVKRGQFVTGRKVLSAETGISESKVERILKVFESEQQIEQQTNNRNRLISIVNYNKFQASKHPTKQQANNKRTTDEQQADTNNNNNNYNNENNDEEGISNLIRSIKEIEKDYLKNEGLIEAVLSARNCPFDNRLDLEKKLSEFCEHLRSIDETTKKEKDFKSHFLNWSRKKKDFEQKEKPKRHKLSMNDLQITKEDLEFKKINQ